MEVLAIRAVGWRVVVGWNNSIYTILVLDACVEGFSILGPAQPSFLVDLDQIIQTFLSRKIANLLIL